MRSFKKILEENKRMLHATPPVIDAYIAFLLRERKTKKKSPCTYCQTTESSTWRPGPAGPSSLCNKCGVTYMDSGKRHRTIDLILQDSKAVWIKKDTASWNWKEDHVANMEDPRIKNWVNRENVRMVMSANKRRRL